MMRRALALCAVALAVRVGVAFSRPVEAGIYPDSLEFFQIRDHVRAGEGPILPPHWKAKRPPLYAFFLATSRNLRAIQVEQSILGALTCVLAAAIARRLWGECVATIAGFACALYPALAALPSVFIIESLDGFLVAAAAYAMVRALEAMKRGWAFAAGIALGLAAVTQAALLFLFVAWLAPLCFFKSGRRWPVALALVAGAVIAPTLWGLRNVRELGAFVPGTTSMGLTFYESFAPQATGGPAVERLAIPREVWELPELERNRTMRTMGLDEIKKDPARAARLGVEKFRRFWSPVPNAEELRSTFNVIVAAATMGPMLVFFLYSVARCRAAGAASAFLFMTALYLTAVHAIFVGSIRYRLAIEPLLIVLASWGACEFWRRVRHGR